LANHKSAIKRARQNEKRRIRNRTWKSRIKTAKSNIEEALKTVNKEAIGPFYDQYASIIDKAASRGVIHRNTASRRKMRISQKIKSISLT